ncbi:MAG: hypothetical protein M3Y89_17475 [Actinomycetota bacterium]|nr:hypothetical protein [Actinomycetota bacterium]
MTEVKALACQLPATSGVPLSRWSCAELAAELTGRGLVEAISPATVWRILAGDAIRPWRHRMWIFPRDPDFAAKAARALDLYARIFEGQALGDDEFVICADEKTSIQARCRCHPTLPPGRARMMRVEHEYERRGALAYLAAYDVHGARVSGRTEDTTGIESFGRLVSQVMTAEPYASAKRVSGSSTMAARIGERRPSNASKGNGPPCASSTCRCTPRGSTSARSTSRSCSARS